MFYYIHRELRSVPFFSTVVSSQNSFYVVRSPNVAASFSMTALESTIVAPNSAMASSRRGLGR